MSHIPSKHAAMDTTLTVRLDEKLKADAENTLDALGVTMSVAVRMFLTQVVLQKRLPFPVQMDPVDAETPPEIGAEIALELIASLTAALNGMAAVEQNPSRLTKIAEVRRYLRSKRLSFDPHDAHQVSAVLAELSGYAASLSAPSGSTQPAPSAAVS